jgi:hypothetical protein
VTCASGLDAEDCAIQHWCPVLDARRERGSWRAPCPECGADRALEFDTPGKSIRWNSFCGEHDKDAVRPRLRELVGACMPGKAARRTAIEPNALVELALADIPPMSLRLALLELAGLSTPDALTKLGVRRDHHSRVIAGRTGGTPKRARNRR